MIRVQDWMASIPEEEKHIAYVGEGKSEKREFLLCGDGWEVYKDWGFHLDMEFDLESITTRDHRVVEKTTISGVKMDEESGTVTDQITTKENYTTDTKEVLNYDPTDVAPLSKVVKEDGIHLTWTVLRQHTQLPGKLWANIRAVGTAADTIKKSAIMVFEVDAAVKATPAAVPPISEFVQMEAEMDVLRQQAGESAQQAVSAADTAMRSADTAVTASSTAMGYMQIAQTAGGTATAAVVEAGNAATTAIEQAKRTAYFHEQVTAATEVATAAAADAQEDSRLAQTAAEIAQTAATEAAASAQRCADLAIAIEDDGQGNVAFVNATPIEEGEEEEPQYATERKASTADGLGTHFVELSAKTLPHAQDGTILTVDTDAAKVMRFGNRNWCPVNSAIIPADGKLWITLPMSMPAGYYTVSATITNWDARCKNPPLDMQAADGSWSGNGGSLGTATYATNGRHGGLYYNKQPLPAFNKIQIRPMYLENEDKTKTPMETRLTDICLRYFPETPFDHPTNGTDPDRFMYMGAYDGVVYDVGIGEQPAYKANTTLLAEGGESMAVSHIYRVEPTPTEPGDTDTVDGGTLYSLRVDGRTYGGFYDEDARKKIDEEVDRLETLIAQNSGSGGMAEEEIPPIYEAAIHYEYTPLPLGVVWSDFTFVGNKLWVFLASSEEFHKQADGKIFICDPDTGQLEKTLYHDFGHCNTVHYNPRNDKLLIGNLGTRDDPRGEEGFPNPALYIFDNVAAWGNLPEGSTLRFEGLATVVDVTNIQATIGTHASAVVACWGECNAGQNNIVYLNGSYNKYWWKILLGTGTNCLAKGTYTAAAEGVFNGTYKVLWFKSIPTCYDAEREVTQGIDFVGGRIHTANGHHGIQWWEWDFPNSGMRRIEHNTTAYTAAGVARTVWSEGLAIRDGYAYVGCLFPKESGKPGGFVKIRID